MCKVDELEKTVHRIPDLSGMEAGSDAVSGTRFPGNGPHADDTLGEVAIPATVMERDRAVGEASDPGDRCGRDLDEIAQARSSRRNCLPFTLEEHELSCVLAWILRHDEGRRRAHGGRKTINP
jgi:hypothetical protein